MQPLKQYSYVHEEAKKIVNGQLVEDKMMNADYNGKILNIDERDNNEVHHYTLDNKHIKKLLGQKTSNMNLLDRIHMDYMKRRHVNKKMKMKTTRKTTRKATRKTTGKTTRKTTGKTTGKLRHKT